ncbi:MAG TPA: protein TolR [Candidatus Binatia bacterium]|nr:protein TolR [Candidatus Binatia bacterium]
MAFETRSQSSSISQINVVPLVDVMLVLLVIFMVTAPILQQGVSVQLPQAKAGALSGEEEQLVVTIDKKGVVYLNDNAIAIDQLGPKLGAVVRLKPDKQVFLRADRSVPYGEVVRVMAAVKSAGVQSLGMITELPTQKK